MYKVKRRFAWGLTSVWVKLHDGSVEEESIALDMYYIVQKSTDGSHWVDTSPTKWYSEQDAYEIMKHLICKEVKTPVIEQLYHKN